MSRCLPQEIVKKYKNTSNPKCSFPYYENWTSLPFKERLELVKLECSAINEHPRMKHYEIIATPYLFDCRTHEHGTWAGDISVSIYFHGEPEKPYDINTVACIGHLPVTYGTLQDKKKVDVWKSQLEKWDI